MEETTLDAEAEVFSIIGGLSLDVLDDLRVHLKINIRFLPDGRKTKKVVLKLLMRYLMSNDVLDTEDEGEALFTGILEFIKQNAKTEVVVTDEASRNIQLTPGERDAKNIQNIGRIVDSQFLDERSLEARRRIFHRDSSRQEPGINGVTLEKRHENKMERKLDQSLWRKDFKVLGSIGLPGQKEKITFSSLAYQIENGLKKGYTDDEICEAVVRAVSPDLQLRGFLEGKSDLTLPRLRRILRSHFNEKDPTTLFNVLSNAAQANNETAQEFVIRLMNLRQKILFVSKEGDSRFEYNEELVQKQFLHSIVTGLRNDSIKSDIKPLINSSFVTDEDLLESLNLAVSDENERQFKIKVGSSCNAVEVVKIKERKKDNPILKELQEMKAQLNEVTAMKSDIEELKKGQLKEKTYEEKPGRFRRRKFGCPACIRDEVERCEHCFLCGSTEHYKAGCRKKSSGK